MDYYPLNSLPGTASTERGQLSASAMLASHARPYLGDRADNGRRFQPGRRLFADCVADLFRGCTIRVDPPELNALGLDSRIRRTCLRQLRLP